MRRVLPLLLRLHLLLLRHLQHSHETKIPIILVGIHQTAIVSSHAYEGIRVLIPCIVALRPDWLLAPQLQGKQVVVDIRGTRVGADIRWFGGDHEGKRGVVRYVQDQHRTNVESFADVMLQGTNDNLTVPLKYLVPAPPERAQSKVIFVSGDNVGQIATLFDYNAGNGNCTVHSENGVLIVQQSQLALVSG